MDSIGVRRKNSSETKWLIISFLGPCVGVIFLVVIFPLIYSLTLSFQSWTPTAPHLGREFVGLDNYLRALRDPRFWMTLKNTGIILIGAVSFEFVLGMTTALLVSSLSERFRKIATTLFLIPMMMVPIVVGNLWKLILNNTYGLLNHYLEMLGINGVSWLGDTNWAMFSVIMADTWEWTPLVYLIILSGIMSLPGEPYEAVSIDGANKLQTFWYITLPLLRPVVLIALLLRVVDLFKLFDVVWMLTEGGPAGSTETSSMFIYFTAFKYFDMGYAAALSFILLFIVSFFAGKLLKQIFAQE